MILDERTEFADATALNTGAAGSYLVGDVIDLTVIGADIGQDTEIWCVIQVDTAVAGTSSTVQFKLASDSVANLVADANATIHFATAAIPEATLIAGYQVAAFRLPLGTYERYLGIIQTTAVAALSAGKINAFLTTDVSKIKHYADATN